MVDRSEIRTWDDYLWLNIENGRHSRHPAWRPSGVWRFIRDDGLWSARVEDSPFHSPERTLEESMRLADRHISHEGELPKGMGERDAPDYGPLWNLK